MLLQAPDVPLQDATNFLFVLLQFLDKHDSKTKKILEKTKEELKTNEPFMYRYLFDDDGITGQEGAFLLCTFWYISALAITGETKKAKKFFDKFREKMPENFLLSEEIDPEKGIFLGNYPQAFSHQGFIMSAYYLERYKKNH